MKIQADGILARDRASFTHLYLVSTERYRRTIDCLGLKRSAAEQVSTLESLFFRKYCVGFYRHYPHRVIGAIATWGCQPQSLGWPHRALRLELGDWLLVLILRGRPAQTKGKGGLIVLALDHVLRAALVEPEDFVIEVETGDEQTQTVP